MWPSVFDCMLHHDDNSIKACLLFFDTMDEFFFQTFIIFQSLIERLVSGPCVLFEFFNSSRVKRIWKCKLVVFVILEADVAFVANDALSNWDLVDAFLPHGSEVMDTS